MSTPLERIRFGALVLAVIGIGGIVGYRVLGDGYSWMDALWMVVITISSVGYSEHSSSTPQMQMFTVVVILLGMTAAAYTFGGFIQLVFEGELETLLGHRRMTRGIDRLSDHVIICGNGRIGEVLSDGLQGKSQFVIIDTDPERIELAKSRDYLCLVGDATEEEVLKLAGVDRAKTLFTGLPGDADNVFITLTARNLNKDIQIIARAEHPSTQKKLRQAGADKVIMPTMIGAHHVERMITRPSTADLMELVSESTFPDLELDEIRLGENSKLVGLTVQDTEANRRHRVLVVAVKNSAGKMQFNPEAGHTFETNDVLMVMGHPEDIQRFCQEYAI